MCSDPEEAQGFEEVLNGSLAHPRISVDHYLPVAKAGDGCQKANCCSGSSKENGFRGGRQPTPRTSDEESLWLFDEFHTEGLKAVGHISGILGVQAISESSFSGSQGTDHEGPGRKTL
jgi:hypothetical protein